MKTKLNKFFVMATFFIIGGLVAPEIKAQNLSEASWVKWYKPDPKNAQKNVRIYRSATAEELSQIATNVKNGKIVGGKTYELPGSSNIRFTLTQPDLWYEYWLMSYRSTDLTVTRENLPEAMARSSVFTWDNNFAGKTINNYYYSQATKTVQYIPNYSGLSASVPIVVYTDGSIKGKGDCGNPGPENGVKTGSTKKDTVFIVKNAIQQQETEIETEIEEEECWKYVWKTQTYYTEEYREVQGYSPRGDYTGLQGFDQQRRLVKVSVPHTSRVQVKVRCEEQTEEVYTDNTTVVRPRRPIFINVRAVVQVVKMRAQATQTQQQGGPVHTGGVGGGPVHTGGSQGGAVHTGGSQGGPVHTGGLK